MKIYIPETFSSKEKQNALETIQFMRKTIPILHQRIVKQIYFHTIDSFENLDENFKTMMIAGAFHHTTNAIHINHSFFNNNQQHVLAHEIGHAFMFNIITSKPNGWEQIIQQIEDTFNKAKSHPKNFPSLWSRQSYSEFFAEVYGFYFTDKTQLTKEAITLLKKIFKSIKITLDKQFKISYIINGEKRKMKQTNTYQAQRFLGTDGEASIESNHATKYPIIFGTDGEAEAEIQKQSHQEPKVFGTDGEAEAEIQKRFKHNSFGNQEEETIELLPEADEETTGNTQSYGIIRCPYCHMIVTHNNSCDVCGEELR